MVSQIKNKAALFCHGDTSPFHPILAAAASFSDVAFRQFRLPRRFCCAAFRNEKHTENHVVRVESSKVSSTEADSTKNREKSIT